MAFEAITAGVNYDPPKEGRGVTLVIELDPELEPLDVVEQTKEVGSDVWLTHLRPVLNEESVRFLAKRLGDLVASWDEEDSE